MTTPAPRSGDGWVNCACGHRHWGLFGAAGLLLGRPDHTGSISHVVLQHRAPWSDQGGTWGIPGGAINLGEGAHAGALREAHEEAGIQPEAVQVVGEHILDHGPWSYTTVLALLKPDAPTHVHAADPESLAVTWVPLAEVENRELLPAFATAWPQLIRALTNDAQPENRCT